MPFEKGYIPYNKGKKLPRAVCKKISLATRGSKNPFFGKKHSAESLTKISMMGKGRKPLNFGKPIPPHVLAKLIIANTGKRQSAETIAKRIAHTTAKGNTHWNWKGGIPRRDIHSLSDPRYRNWRKGVFERDGFKCRMRNKDCHESLQAHHILRWSEFVELRYEINNGITLCQHHHPRKREDEQRLIPTLRELVGSNTH